MNGGYVIRDQLSMSGPPPRYIYINPANGGHELYSVVEEYMRYYNYERSHESIGKLTPSQGYSVQNNSNKLTKYSTKNLTLLV